MSQATIEDLRSRTQDVADEIGRVIVGKHEVVRLVLASLLARGHVLVEDVPGVGKTTLAKSVARAIGCSFSRIQFTPDLLPSDVTGTSIYNQKAGEFEFRPGPVFTNVLLADEINRATPKTQSALLECMEELQVSIDGTTRRLPRPFLVIATENNVERGSTYSLPEAQLDRFLVRVSLGYPTRSEEVSVLDGQMRAHPLTAVESVLSADELITLQDNVQNVHLDDSLKEYIVDIVAATRSRPEILLGASPRGSLSLMRISRALAAISGRDYVLPDDIKQAAPHALAHRLMLTQDTWHNDLARNVILDILATIPVPVDYGRSK